MLSHINTLLSDLDNNGLPSVINKLNLSSYQQTRNYLDGAVTKLSPLITHGVITIPEIIQNLDSHSAKERAGFIFQLGWREYFLKIWQNYNLLEELRTSNKDLFPGVPVPILEQGTGIDLIDGEIRKLVTNGYIHNHSRLWIASLATHIYQSSWQDSAKWMYYHLLDGCPASNFLSWQWVNGSFSSKAYLFNQENINKYSKTNQTGTVIDCDYSRIAKLNLNVPRKQFINADLVAECQISLKKLSSISKEQLLQAPELLIYSIFTLDSKWQSDSTGLKVLWLNSDFFNEFPISSTRVTLITKLISRIPNLNVYYGDLSEEELVKQKIYLKDHPIFKDWKLKKDPNNYILQQIYPNKDQSYFWYWKRIAMHLGIHFGT